MITPTILPEEKENKYFLHNQRLANEWEDYKSKYNGTITGEFNIYLLEFNLIFSTGNYSVKISGHRQQKNTSGSLLHPGFHLTKTTNFEITPSGFGNKYWKIYKSNKLKDLLHGLFGRVEKISFNEQYSVQSRSIIGKSEFLSSRQYELIKSIPQLAYIKNKNSKLTIHFYELLSINITDQLIKHFTIQ